MREKITFQADRSFLNEMLHWVRSQVAKTGCNRADQRKIELALEEAIINIINYAYPNKKGTIELDCTINANKIEFTLIDQGVPFNPLLQEHPQAFEQGLEKRQEGGLGIFFMRNLMDGIHYERRHFDNVLTLFKTLISIDGNNTSNP